MTRFGSEFSSFPDGCEANSLISHTACSFWIPFEFQLLLRLEFAPTNVEMLPT